MAADEEGTSWDPTLGGWIAVVGAGLVAALACIGVAWLARVAVTGEGRRPGWRMIVGAPVLYALLLATIFVRP